MMEKVKRFIFASQAERDQAVAAFQARYRSKVWDRIVPITSALSGEEFFILLFMVLLWGPICHARAGWTLAITIGYGFTLGNYFKNYFGFRRPVSPSVARFGSSSSESIEFGFPSTHAMIGAASSSVIAYIALFHHGYSSSPVATALLLLYVLVWSITISVSRVYLGAHSIQDVAAGWTLGLLYAQVIIVLSTAMQASSEKGDYIFRFLPLLVMTTWAILFSHPVNKSSWLRFHLSEGTMENSACQLGVALSGIFFLPLNPGDQYCVGVTPRLAIRFVIGFAILAVIYVGSTEVFPLILSPLFQAMGIPGNYMTYKAAKTYLHSSLAFYSQIEKEDEDINNSINGKVIDIPSDPYSQLDQDSKMTPHHNPSNPEKKIAWVRLATKVLQYFVFSSALGFGLPQLFVWLAI